MDRVEFESMVIKYYMSKHVRTFQRIRNDVLKRLGVLEQNKRFNVKVKLVIEVETEKIDYAII